MAETPSPSYHSLGHQILSLSSLRTIIVHLQTCTRASHRSSTPPSAPPPAYKTTRLRLAPSSHGSSPAGSPLITCSPSDTVLLLSLLLARSPSLLRRHGRPGWQRSTSRKSESFLIRFLLPLASYTRAWGGRAWGAHYDDTLDVGISLDNR